jgi:hypothetical protein
MYPAPATSARPRSLCAAALATSASRSPPSSPPPYSALTPRAWRLTLALPAAGAAAGYLQARQQFCANYGFRGLYNFDSRGHEQRVPATVSQAEDRRRARQITATSTAIGVGVGLIATLIKWR